MSSVVEKKLAEASAKHTQLEKELGNVQTQRTRLETQLRENEMVQEEFALLKEGETVFKMVGPTLLKQDAEECKQNVEHRINHIKKAIETVEDQMARTQKDLEQVRKTIMDAKKGATKQ